MSLQFESPSQLDIIRRTRYRALINEKWKRRCRVSLEDWSKECMWDFGFEPAAHHLYLIEKLEEVIAGEIDRLMVFMPPGSAKSTYVSELLPPFWFNKFPRSSIIGCSHTGELAERFGRKVRNRILQKADVLGYSLDESTEQQAAGKQLLVENISLLVLEARLLVV